ncbi:MAG: HIT domain-containing protein, partial [Thermoleophilia bacterium]
MNRHEHEAGCLFCAIVAREVAAQVIMESDSFIAIHDKYPKAPVHALVIPKRHIKWLNDIGGAEEGFSQAMLDFIVAVADELGVTDSGYRVINNVGSGGGQVIFHLHWHILAGASAGF